MLNEKETHVSIVICCCCYPNANQCRAFPKYGVLYKIIGQPYMCLHVTTSDSKSLKERGDVFKIVIT